MKKLINIIMLLGVIVTSCKKGVRDDLKGNVYFRGRLFYVNTLSQNEPITPLPLSGKTVNIGFTSDSAKNFLYSVTTDVNGYFIFTNLDPTLSYVIFSRDTMGGITFYQQKILPISKVPIDTLTLQLFPSTIDQNGLVFTVVDNSGKPVNGCFVCLFQSKILFQIDTCAGASYMLTTDPYGNAFQVNVPVGKYYAQFKQPIGKLFLTNTDSINVALRGVSIKKDTVK